MVEAVESYERAVGEHQWRLPERFNIAAEVCDRHPREKLAMIHEHFSGAVREGRRGPGFWQILADGLYKGLSSNSSPTPPEARNRPLAGGLSMGAAGFEPATSRV